MTRVVVVSPGTHPEPQQFAIAASTVAQTDFLTSAVRASSGWLARGVSHLPQGSSQLSNRLIDLPARNVHGFATSREAAYQVARRVSLGHAQPVLDARNRLFHARSADWLTRNGADLVWAQHGSAEVAFAAAPNAIKVLNFPIAHHRWADAYMRQEALQNPEWAQFLQYVSPTGDVADRFDQEIEAADHVLVASSFVRRTFMESGVPGAKVSVLPLGSADLFRDGTIRSYDRRGRPLRVLFAGQVNQRKGVSYLLDAVRELGAHVEELRFVGPVMSDMRQRLLATDLPVTVTGPVTADGLRDHYRWADVVVLPSLIEGFGLTALEAMSTGTPVIVTTHTFGEDLIQQGVTGFVIPPRDGAAISRTLAHIASTDFDAESMSLASAAASARSNWDAYRARAVAWLEATLRSR